MAIYFSTYGKKKKRLKPIRDKNNGEKRKKERELSAGEHRTGVDCDKKEGKRTAPNQKKSQKKSTSWREGEKRKRGFPRREASTKKLRIQTLQGGKKTQQKGGKSGDSTRKPCSRWRKGAHKRRKG